MPRPVRVYQHIFARVEAPLNLQPLSIVTSGNTPCQARRFAFTQLERRIRQDQLPAQGWKLIQQQLLPLTGSQVNL